jgi:hypothetical protein
MQFAHLRPVERSSAQMTAPCSLYLSQIKNNGVLSAESSNRPSDCPLAEIAMARSLTTRSQSPDELTYMHPRHTDAAGPAKAAGARVKKQLTHRRSFLVGRGSHAQRIHSGHTRCSQATQAGSYETNSRSQYSHTADAAGS